MDVPVVDASSGVYDSYTDGRDWLSLPFTAPRARPTRTMEFPSLSAAPIEPGV